jgi:hypothetical protein
MLNSQWYKEFKSLNSDDSDDRKDIESKFMEMVTATLSMWSACAWTFEHQFGSAAPLSHVMKRKQGPITSPSQTKKTKGVDSVVLLQDLLDFNRGVQDGRGYWAPLQTYRGNPHEFHLVVVQHDEDTKEIEFEILEAEFYVLIGGCYEDPFTHWSEKQKIGGQWCTVKYSILLVIYWPANGNFHRAPRKSADSYRRSTSQRWYCRIMWRKQKL